MAWLTLVENVCLHFGLLPRVVIHLGVGGEEEGFKRPQITNMHKVHALIFWDHQNQDFPKQRESLHWFKATSEAMSA